MSSGDAPRGGPRGPRQKALDIAPKGEGTVEGEVLRVVFERPAEDFRILKLAVAGQSEPTTVLGTLPEVRRGQALRVHGSWSEDEKWGAQLRARSVEVLAPSTAKGVERFLASGAIKGVGPTLAKRIVDRLGVEALRKIEEDPEALTEVPGLGAARARRIAAEVRAQAENRDALAFLHGHGLGSAMAQRVLQRYGKDATRRIQANPYVLALDVSGIGFLTADALAQSLGIDRDSPFRMQAGTLHVLDEATSRGHLFLPRRVLIGEAARVLGTEPEPIEEAIRSLVADGRVVLEELADPSEGRAVYLTTLHEMEGELAKGLARLLREKPSSGPRDPSRAVERAEERLGMELAATQRAAVATSVDSKVMVLTGGPGTGKTTIVRAIVELFEDAGLEVALAAPTGRAARRLAEATGRPAATLHRLLEYQPGVSRFQRDADQPLEVDVAIVDEVSMVDLPLATALVAALPPKARLVLVGDADQLPSVGPGAVLADVIASKRVPVVRLEEIFRQARESGIVINAHRVQQGQRPGREADAPWDDFYTVERAEPDAIVEMVADLVTSRIPTRFGLDPMTDVQVLTPMRRGPLGAERLNEVLRERLNSGSRALKQGGRRGLLVGDRVMQLRNNYRLEVMNGEIGRIVCENDDGEVQVRFEERIVDYQAEEVDALGLAYACSIHKSQGSEYPAVVIPLHTQHYVMLRRNLLYTAITRGKRVVVIVGSRKALDLAVGEARGERRYTLLARRLREQAG